MTYLPSHALVNGMTYYDWVEGLDTNGTLTRHEPVSVTYASPTAVRVAGFDAASVLPATAVPVVVMGLVLATLGGIALRRRGGGTNSCPTFRAT